MHLFYRLFLLTAAYAAMMGLAACAPTAVTPAPQTAVSQTAVSQAATPTITALPPETADTPPAPSPSATPAPADALPPDVQLPETATPHGRQLPQTEEVGFRIAGQFGGTMHALDVVDGMAYVGAGPRLLAVDVSDPANPALLGHSDVLADMVRDVAVVDGVAYLAAGRGGVIVLDVSDPAAMRIIDGGPGYAGANPPSALRLDVMEGTVYVTDIDYANSAASLLRFDAGDPADPLVFLDGTAMQLNDSVVIGGGRLAVVGNGRLQLRDPANPAAVLGEAPLTSGMYANHAHVRGDRAYVVESGGPNGVEVFDLSDPAAPTAVGELVEMDIYIFDQMAASESTLFIAGTFGEFGYCSSQISTVDISGGTPANPYTFDPQNCVTAVDVVGETLYVAGRSGLQIFDAAAPDAPLLRALFTHPHGFHSVDAVEVQQDVVRLLTNEGNGYDLHTLRLEGETAVSLHVSEAISERALLDLLRSGDTLIAPIWMGGLITFDVSDPLTPQLLYHAGSEGAMLGDFYTMVLEGDVLYTPIIDGVLVGGVAAIGLSDPAQPRILSTTAVEQPQILSIALDGDRLFVLTQHETNQVHVIDVSRPDALAVVSSLTLPAAASKLFMAGGRLYAACDGWNCQQLFAIDASDPQHLALTETYRLPLGVRDVTVDANGRVYLQTADSGIWLLDAVDPDNVRLTGRLMLPAQYGRLKFINGKIYAAMYDGGLFVVETEE